MSYKIIPLDSTKEESYKFRCDVNGTVYWFDFHYNSRLNRWICNLYDDSSNLLCAGQPIINDNVMFDNVIKEGITANEIFTLQKTSFDSDIDQSVDYIGESVLMMFEATE